MSYLASGQSFAQAIVDSIKVSLLVVDEKLSVVSANRAYCETFKVGRGEAEGRHVYELGNGEWDIPELRARLAAVPEGNAWDGCEIEMDFSGLGRRTMHMDARAMVSDTGTSTKMLVTITDVTEMRGAEFDLKNLLHRKDILLEEMSHRVANSLMMIASILMLRARTTLHDETRSNLQDAYHRVLSIAAVQKQLRMAEIDAVKIDRYLSDLCEQLTASIIESPAKISLKVRAMPAAVSSDHAVHVGLIVTELVINALKHAFPHDRDGGEVVVAYETNAYGWTLTVSDNGIGGLIGEKAGLGTALINALARQMDAQVAVSVGSDQGRSTSITHASAMASGQLLTGNFDRQPEVAGRTAIIL
jgi:chemotaxis protein methyltransferase CheR